MKSICTRGPFDDPPAVRRVAMVVVHSNPLVEPGAGDAGGMTVYVRQLARTLAARGTEVDVFTRADAPLAAGSESSSGYRRPREVTLYPGVQLVHIEAGPPALAKEELAAHLPEFAALTARWAAARGREYDVIHSHYWLSGIVASALARRWEVPFIHTFHTLGKVKNSRLRNGDAAEPDHRLRGESRVVAEADAIVASTADELDGLTDMYAAHLGRIHLIAPGVDHALFNPGDRSEAKTGLGLAGRNVLLFVGRLQPLKGADTAIRALARLGGEAVLVVVGGRADGDDHGAHLRALAAQLRVADRVRFVPAQPHAALPAYYRAADVCLVPSHTESFGLVALEAQACGIPVVASSVGGLREIVKDGRTGYLVDPGDPEAFAARAAGIIADPSLAAAMGRMAAESSNAYSWERCAAAVQELYSEALGSPAGLVASPRISSL